MKPVSPLILVVDDHPLVREGLRAAIRDLCPGAVVTEAENASKAWASISARHPDLIMLDVHLPGESGIDLTHRIRATNKRIKILMIAGEIEPWAANEAIEAGASGFISKTRSTEFLARAIHAVMEGKVFLCPDAEEAIRRAKQYVGTAREPPGPTILSEREREVLKYIAHGENTKAVASLLHVSPKTIEAHRRNLMRKLGLHTVAGLTRYAIRHGLISP
jgi:DNA-binding NarL/FixJ family response regulator